MSFFIPEMQLDVSFAKPVGPYNSPLNYIPRTYCHVELSFHTTATTFRRQLTQYIEGSNSPGDVQVLLNRIRRYHGKLIVCFYINWGETVSCRYLSELVTDPYLRPPEKPVYDSIPVKVSIKQSDELTKFYIQNLGKAYDYFRACLSMCPVALRSANPNRFYCSQLVLHSLKSTGIEFDCNIDHVSPLDVYKLLKNMPINREECDNKDGPECPNTSSESSD